MNQQNQSKFEYGFCNRCAALFDVELGFREQIAQCAKKGMTGSRELTSGSLEVKKPIVEDQKDEESFETEVWDNDKKPFMKFAQMNDLPFWSADFTVLNL